MLLRRINHLERTLQERKKPGYVSLVREEDGIYYDYDTGEPIEQLPGGEVIIISYVSPDKQPYDS